MRRGALLCAVVVFASGCAYYNGVYNARTAARTAADRLWQGDEGAALAQYRLAMEKAETVLVRHPGSRWQAQALHLAGIGAAYVGECERAERRLAEYRATDDTDATRRDRATIAEALCALRGGRVTSAGALLEPLLDRDDDAVAREARLWAARAALAAGDRDRAERFFAGLGVQRADWELVAASVSAADWSRAESLLVARAERADWREDVLRYTRALWSAERRDGVLRIAERYRRARLREPLLLRLQFAIGELGLRDGFDSIAVTVLGDVDRLAGRDTVLRREARARLALLSLAEVDSLAAVDSIVSEAERRAAGSIVTDRMRDGLLLYRMLREVVDPTGAALFLAGEVARDSLRAPRLAARTFLSVPEAGTVARRPPLAPKALFAASLLLPDSAADLRARIVAEYPDSPMAAWLRGEDPGALPAFTQNARLLEARWLATQRAFADSLRIRRQRETTIGG